MFWTDIIAENLSKSGPHLVDDAKTPSGKIHVGALRGVIIHDLIYKTLTEKGVKTRFTYIIDDFDPMDALPTYLDQEKYLPFMGKPLKDVPAPVGEGSYAKFYAEDFIKVINSLGVEPEIIWMSQVYEKGLMNDVIKTALDNKDKIQQIYHEVSGSQKDKNWYPFSPVCDNCGLIGTTKTVGWDGTLIQYVCEPDMVRWAKGCSFKGKKSPFDGGGKMPWKVEWPARWKVLGVTVEGEGKDHASKGGSRDIANHLTTEVFKGNTPFDVPYEHFLFGGRKMSSSKGVGATAEEVSEILPPELLRFLMTRTRFTQAIDFDPTQVDTIPKLYDEYDRCYQIWSGELKADGGEDLGRAYELSQIDKPKKVFIPRFNLLVNWVQMPNVDPLKEAGKLKGSSLSEFDKDEINLRIKYVKIWLDKFADDDAKFKVTDRLPEEVKELSQNQRELLKELALEVGNSVSAEELQDKIYQIGQGYGLSGKETFQAVYTAILGKDHGPKAGWLLLTLDKEFVKKRFEEAAVE